MHSITSVDALRQAIVALERRRREQEQGLNDSFMDIVESLKPVNVIRTIARDLAGSPGVRHQAYNAGLGLVAGFAVRKLLFGAGTGPLKKILGAALQVGITSLVGGKGDAIQAAWSQLLRSVLVGRNHSGGSETPY
ncbi:MAG: hypothetical protein EHM80_15395 [Nitrospiraceae bacterium]|nr:MAG: hypothetical protein EHM80_15395 [Nitrospiraceae bacterium]